MSKKVQSSSSDKPTQPLTPPEIEWRLVATAGEVDQRFELLTEEFLKSVVAANRQEFKFENGRLYARIRRMAGKEDY